MKIWRQLPANAMTIFSPNSVFFKPAIHLHSRPLPVPWSEKNLGCIKCSSEGREFSTSIPVRYIPKKNLDSGESERLSLAKERSYGAKKHLNSDARGVDYSRNAFILESNETKGQGRANEDSRESEGLSSSKERAYGAKEHVNSDAQRVDFSRNDFILESNETKGRGRANEVYGELEGLSSSAKDHSYGAKEHLNSDDQRDGFSRNAFILGSTETKGQDRANEVSGESEGLSSLANERSYGAKEHLNSDAPGVDFSRNAFILESVETKGQDRADENSQESEGLSSSSKERSYGPKEHLNSDVQRVDFSCNAFILESVETKGQNRANESMDFDVGSRVREDFNREDDNILEEPEEVMQEMEVSDGEEHNENSVLQGSEIQQDVKNLAVEMLAKRAFTAAELRKKLLGKHFPRVIVDAVIMDFQKRGFVNDSLYAETYSRSRWSTSTWGPGRIKKALLGKGVNSEDAEKAVKVVLNDTKSTEDEECMFGMSQQSMDHLFVQASKQWQRSGNVPRETQKSRVIRWLQYRGFSWSIISVVLKKLQSGDRL